MKLTASYILSLLLCTSLLVACSNVDDEDDLAATVAGQEQSAQQTRSPLTLTITIGQEHATRAVPTGGEEGDLLENGQHHENDITNLVIFKVNGAVVNGADNLPVKKIAFVPDVDFHPGNVQGNIKTDVNLSPYTDYSYSMGDHFIVVTNMGNITASTLGELRDKLVNDAWMSHPSGIKGNYTGFVMSNEAESRYVEGSGSPDDPRVIQVSVERVAARIDLCVDGSTVDGVCRNFEARDNNAKVGNVIVSHARVMNGMIRPTYTIKRLAPAADGSKIYLGDEHTPTSYYVCEPNTWRKPFASDADLSEWYGSSRHALAYELQNDWFEDDDRIRTTSVGDGFNQGTTYDAYAQVNYYVLDYVNENTMTPEATTAKTTTAVALNAVYQPAVVHASIDADGQPVVDPSYVRGQTFWRYRPITQGYDETKALYFSNKAAAESYQALHTDIVSQIEEYTSARCYYIVYLRHDNSPVSPYVSPMEFGIVRNNIYRLRLSFTGPGYSSIPDDTEIQPEGVKPYIYVKKWYYIEHPTIEI